MSTDNEKAHQKFIAKEKLPFSLLADTDKKLHTLYGTWVEKSMYGRKYMGTARITFIINEGGVIEEIIEKVDTKNHTDQILHQESTTVASSPQKTSVKKAKPTKKVAPNKTAAKKK